MMRSTGVLLVGALLGALAVTCARPQPSGDGAAPSVVERALLPAPAFAKTGPTGDVSLADVAEKAVPSVVNISATRVRRVSSGIHPFFEDPFFRDFFGPGDPLPRERKERSLGSGVIVSDDGVILTNNHVIEHAEELQVTLNDGREVKVKVVGTDPQTDLAVLKVDEDTEKLGLEPIPLGDSDALRLGDVVLAIGNPFGVGQTVTMGIVSATGRTNVPITEYADFIQTDAAINPGNSGGALINMKGELVGINTAIVSRSGGYQGIGFAIPMNGARPVMESLLRHGKVLRGWLGVTIQDLTPELVAGLGLAKNTRGVLISDVLDDSPAAKAGIRRGDVILRIAGVDVDSAQRLKNTVAAAGVGKTVDVELLRDGKKKRLSVTLGELPERYARGGTAAPARGGLDGLSVVELDPSSRRRFDIPSSVTSGVVVSQVAPGSPAEEAGLRRGDVILEVNRKAVSSVRQLESALDAAGKQIVLLVHRDGATIFLGISR